MASRERSDDPAQNDHWTKRNIGAAIEVHKELGPGLLESIYEECLAHVLIGQGILVQRQVEVPIVFRGRELAVKHRLDLMIESSVVVEMKSCERLLPVHEAQLLTYLRMTGCRIGLLLNFNVAFLKDGIVRRVL